MSNFRPAGFSDDESGSDDDFYDRPRRQNYPPPQNAKKKIENALQDAIINNNTYEVEKIINNELRGNVNMILDSGWTPLMHACFHAQDPIVKLLLQKGADPNLGSVEAKIKQHQESSSNIIANDSQLSTKQPPTLTKPRTGSSRAVPPTAKSETICRDYVWGICSNKEWCKYTHKLVYESMLSILKFCHNYQNRSGCVNPYCTYLHASREEEELFLTKGVIPRVLAERYASNLIPGEPLPQIIYMNKRTRPTHAPQPAPAPRPATVGMQMMTHPTITQIPVSNMISAPLPSAIQLNQPTQFPLTMNTEMHAVMISSMLAPGTTMAMPAPQHTTIVATTPETAQPLQYSVPALNSMTPRLQLQEPPPHYNPPVLFDPNRPPPRIPVKRPAPAPLELEAEPIKKLKLNDCVGDLCDSCIKQNLRSILDQVEIDKNEKYKKYKRRIYEKEKQKYHSVNIILRDMLSPSMYNLVNEFLEINIAATDTFSTTSSP